MTLIKLYEHVIESYGKRGCWISELASNLGISSKSANHLTYALGYRRGRMVELISYDTFAEDEGVRAIQKRL